MLCQLRLAQVTPQQMADSNVRYAAAPWANATNAGTWRCAPSGPRARSIRARPSPYKPLCRCWSSAVNMIRVRRRAMRKRSLRLRSWLRVRRAGSGTRRVDRPILANGIVYSFLNDPLRRPQSECLQNTRHPGFTLRAALSRPVITLLSVVLMGVLAWSGWRGLQSFDTSPRLRGASVCDCWAGGPWLRVPRWSGWRATSTLERDAVECRALCGDDRAVVGGGAGRVSLFTGR